MTVFFFSFLALFPSLCWISFFLFRDTHPEPKKWILLAFGSGVLAVLPLLGVSEIWRMFTGENLVTWISHYSEYSWIVLIFSIFFFALLEEFFKHRAVLGLGSEVHIRFDEITDGMMYSISAALGFSAMENLMYLWSSFLQTGQFGTDFWSLFLVRSLGTMLGHIVFSGVFGFFWGLAIFVRFQKNKFFKGIEKREMRRFFEKFVLSSDPKKSSIRKLGETITFYTIRCFIFKKTIAKESLSTISLVTEGFWLAVLLHTLFNFLVSTEWKGQNLSFLVVPLLMTGLIFLLRRLSSLYNIPLRSKIK